MYKKHFVLRVLLQKSDGSIKEEFWQDKSTQDEKLVKMGDVNNFHSLLGSLHSPSVRQSISNFKPVSKIKSALTDELY